VQSIAEIKPPRESEDRQSGEHSAGAGPSPPRSLLASIKSRPVVLMLCAVAVLGTGLVVRSAASRKESPAVSLQSGTAQVERRGLKRTVGPSSATVGEGVIYVGNRGDSSVCAVGAESLHVGPCVRLESLPDALAYVAATREVWVTTPRDKSITVIDAASAGTLTRTAKINLDGEPEGFAVDDERGVFYTNLEDKDRTLSINTRSRRVTRAWTSGCGEDGPKGLALDHGLDFLFVACRDRVMVLDAGHEGKLLSTTDVGDGIDNIDYVERRHELYAAAARAATLTIARLDPRGRLTPLAIVATVSGARNAVATAPADTSTIQTSTVFITTGTQQSSATYRAKTKPSFDIGGRLSALYLACAHCASVRTGRTSSCES